MKAGAITLLCLHLAIAAAGAEPLADARELFDAGRYPEARVALEKIVATEPRHAAACHLLGLTLSRRADAKALAEAVPWLEKAIALEPRNATFVGDYGGVCLQLADRERSYTYATRGRDAMEKAIVLDPGYLDARDGLMQFYAQAPWPLGSRAKAQAQAREIARHHPDRGLMAQAYLLRLDRKTAEIFALCEQALKASPGNPVVLYEIGRTASLTGEQVARGIAALQQASTASASPLIPAGDIQYRLGLLLEKSGDRQRARTAYEAAVAAKPEHRQAAAAIVRLAP